MKNILSRPTIFLLPAMLVAFWSCSSEDSKPFIDHPIEGIWFNEHSARHNGITFNSRLEYHFHTDLRVEIFRKIFDLESGKLLGYQARTIGKYILKGDTLQISHLETYAVDASKSYYSSLEHLIFIGAQGDLNVLIAFDQPRTRVTFHYPHCPPNSNCIDYQVFELEKRL